ncbi:MAG: SRPBCC domain-containing protein [Acidobacteriota bacterium]|nr:SRPBCC domain-containing protein [Acidobacteriota bacterium]
MTAATQTIPTRSVEDLILEIRKEIHVNASVETTFAALLEQIGTGNERPDGVPMPMKLEAWPGGRWYRDLGDGNGHFWGHVQAIKRPTLIEIAGPLFASYPFLSNVQYRLSESNGGTLITFHHKALGLVDEQHRQGVQTGWNYTLECVRKRAEGVK